MGVSREKVVAGAALFADLDKAEQAEIVALLRPFEFGSGKVLFREGEIADRLYLITRGRVAIHIGAGERLLLLRTAGPNDALGEMALNGSTPRSGTATAVEPVAGFYLETGDFDVIRSIGRPLAGKVLRRLALELCARERGATADRMQDLRRSRAQALTLARRQDDGRQRRPRARRCRQLGPLLKARRATARSSPFRGEESNLHRGLQRPASCR